MGSQQSKGEGVLFKKKNITYATKNDITHKIVLLGAGNSGKTTVFKQIRERFRENDEYPDEFPFSAAFILKTFVYNFICFLNNIESEFGSFSSDLRLQKCLRSEFYVPFKSVSAPNPTSSLTQEQVTLVKEIWNSSRCIELLSEHKHKHWISESVEYFVENIDRMSAVDYVPSEMDYFRCDVLTLGFDEYSFQSENVNFFVLDTGGQRSERNKWISSFETMSVIGFVASLGDFDEGLFEDIRVNCLQETIKLFKNVLNFLVLKNLPVVLILTKADILKRKLEEMEKKSENLDKYFPELELGTNYDNAFEKVKKHIEDLIIGDTDFKKRKSIVKYWCAIDSKESKNIIDQIVIFCSSI